MDQNLSQFQDAIATYIHTQTFSRQPQQLYAPIRYIMNLKGKRIRPLLTLLAYYQFDDDYTQALPAAFAVELFHNFSLVHDDIMDQAPLRRGQPSVHQQFGLNTAILSGDAMLIYVYEYLTQAAPTHMLPTLLHTFNQVAIGVCEGQQYDMQFESNDTVHIEEYLHMIELKTAVLIGGALKIGALCAQAEDTSAHILYEFGRNLGIAFQLQDDWLDTFGNPKKTGKQQAGDIIHNKKTWMYLKALELATPSQRKKLQELYRTRPDDPTQKIQTVRAIFEALDIPKQALQMQKKFADQAFAQLEALPSPPHKKCLLFDLAQWLMQRDK